MYDKITTTNKKLDGSIGISEVEIEDGVFIFNGSVIPAPLDPRYAKAENFVTLTQAEYDALVDAGTLNPATYYFIKQGE